MSQGPVWARCEVADIRRQGGTESGLLSIAQIGMVDPVSPQLCHLEGDHFSAMRDCWSVFIMFCF